jgi:hypothetical protein
MDPKKPEPPVMRTGFNDRAAFQTNFEQSLLVEQAFPPAC